MRALTTQALRLKQLAVNGVLYNESELADAFIGHVRAVAERLQHCEQVVLMSEAIAAKAHLVTDMATANEKIVHAQVVMDELMRTNQGVNAPDDAATSKITAANSAVAKAAQMLTSPAAGADIGATVVAVAKALAMVHDASTALVEREQAIARMLTGYSSGGGAVATSAGAGAGAAGGGAGSSSGDGASNPVADTQVVLSTARATAASLRTTLTDRIKALESEIEAESKGDDGDNGNDNDEDAAQKEEAQQRRRSELDALRTLEERLDKALGALSSAEALKADMPAARASSAGSVGVGSLALTAAAKGQQEQLLQAAVQALGSINDVCLEYAQQADPVAAQKVQTMEMTLNAMQMKVMRGVGV